MKVSSKIKSYLFTMVVISTLSSLAKAQEVVASEEAGSDVPSFNIPVDGGASTGTDVFPLEVISAPSDSGDIVMQPMPVGDPVALPVEGSKPVAGVKPKKGKRGGMKGPKVDKACMDAALASVKEQVDAFRAEMKANFDSCKASSADQAAMKSCLEAGKAAAQQSEIGQLIEAARQSCQPVAAAAQ